MVLTFLKKGSVLLLTMAVVGFIAGKLLVRFGIPVIFFIAEKTAWNKGMIIENLFIVSATVVCIAVVVIANTLYKIFRI